MSENIQLQEIIDFFKEYDVNMSEIDAGVRFIGYKSDCDMVALYESPYYGKYRPRISLFICHLSNWDNMIAHTKLQFGNSVAIFIGEWDQEGGGYTFNEIGIME